MSSRHQPEHGADSAEGLALMNLESAAEMLAVEMATAGYADPESVEQWRAPIESARSILKALERRGYTLTHWHTTHLRPDTTAKLLGWIDRRLADIESDLGDQETMQSLGLHGRVKLHERRDTLKFMRAQIEQDAA